jgi:hypothetical protein
MMTLMNAASLVPLAVVLVRIGVPLALYLRLCVAVRSSAVIREIKEIQMLLFEMSQEANCDSTQC